ncbi:MAG TPA: protoporphyrinogen oxidase [Kofleriaceae bacterium]
MTRVCVIGGGLAGLTAARALVAAGFDAHVREASDHIGGVIGTNRVDGFLRETAASSFLGTAPHGAMALCAELGVPVEAASPRAKKRWIYIDHKLRALPSNPLALVRSDLLTWRGKLDLLREPLQPTRGEGDESIFSFAARRFGPEVARAVVAPFVTGIFAADAHDVSLEAGFPTLAGLDLDGGLVRGMLKRHVGAVVGRARALVGGPPPKPRPAKGPGRGLQAPVGGLGAMIAALEYELGPRVRKNAPVARVAPVENGVLVDGETWDACVMAIAAQDARGLVSDVPGLPSRLEPMRRAHAAIAYLGYPEADVPGAVDGFGFLVAQGEELRVLGVVFESVVWPDRAPAGHVLLRCIFGGSRDPDAARLSDTEILEHAMNDVGTVLGARGTPVHASVVRWSHGLAQYPVGHKDHVRAAVTAARSHRIVLAGADYRGPGVNDICADAAVVVDEVRACT